MKKTMDCGFCSGSGMSLTVDFKGYKICPICDGVGKLEFNDDLLGDLY